MAKTSEKIKNLDPEIGREIIGIRKKTIDLPAVIEDEKTKAVVAAHQGLIYKLIRNIESWYDGKIKPLNAVIKDLRDEKKSVLEEPSEWNDEAQKLLSDYFQKKEAEAEKERIKLQKKLDADAASARKKEVSALKKDGDKEVARELANTPIIAPIAEVKNVAEIEGKSFRDDWEVIECDLNLVPEEYIKKTLKLREVKEALKNGVRDIPGLSCKPIKTFVNG